MNEPTAASNAPRPQPQVPPTQAHEPALRLALRFAHGRGRLVASPQQHDGVRVARLILRLPELSFPCDVSSGVDSFRHAPSALHALTLQLTGQALCHLLRHAHLYEEGLGPMTAEPQEGHLLLQGTLTGASDEASVPFSLRAAAIPQGAQDVAIVFYEAHLYGPSAISALQLPERLRHALMPLWGEHRIAALGPSAWSLNLAALCAQILLPHHGFGVPDCSGVAQSAVSLSPLGLRLMMREADAEDDFDTSKKPCPDARAAWEAHSHFAAAELALAQGNSVAAAKHYFEAAWGEGHAPGQEPLPRALRQWAKERCHLLALQDPTIFDAPLPEAEDAPSPVLQLMAAAEHSGRQDRARAAEVYEAIAHSAENDLERSMSHLAAARELRASGESEPRARAIEHLRAACALGPVPPYALAWLCELLEREGCVPDALEAARSWVLALEGQDHLDLDALAHASVAAAKLCLRAGPLFEEAQGHLEQLLARKPGHPAALWQLVRVHGAACHIPQAQKALAALVAQAKTLAQRPRAARLVALGDLARDALGDKDRALALYAEALEVQPDCARAHLRLAQATPQAPHTEPQVQHLLAALDAESDADADMSQGTPAEGPNQALTATERASVHLGLGSHFMATAANARGPRDLPLGLKHLRQALELDPQRDDVRLRLEDALRAAQDWAALADLLVSTGAQAAARGDLLRARRWQLQAARLHLGERNEPQKAQAPLLALVRRCPDDEEALHLLVPLLEANADTVTLRQVLQEASMQQSLPALRRGLWLHKLWQTEARAGADGTVLLPLLQRLLQIFPQNHEAALCQVQLLEGQQNLPPERVPEHDAALAQAYSHLAQACCDGQERALTLRKAARTYSFVGAPDRALEALEQSLDAAPLDVETWLLGAQLKHDVQGVDAARAWLSQATQAWATASPPAYAHRVFDRLAELCAFSQDTDSEIEALCCALRLGGTSYGLCVRLLSALERAGRHKERADWLMVWAEAGWPLEMGPSLHRAAALYEMLGERPLARKAYRAWAQLDAQSAQDAGLALAAMGHAHAQPDDVVEGLTLQHRAAVRRQDHEAAKRLRDERVLALDAAGDDQGAAALCREILTEEPRARLAHSYLARACIAQRAWSTALDHGLQASLWGSDEALAEQRALTLWSDTYGLALDLRPELKDALAAACPQAGLGVAYSERLMARGDSQNARDLLLHMLEHAASGHRAAEVRLRLAQLYTTHLPDLDEACALLRQNLADNSTDVPSRQALLQVYHAQKATGQEAELHLALSNLVNDLDEALHHTLQSASLYAQDPKERGTAEQIVMAFARRSDVPKVCPKLWQGLRHMGMLRQLHQILAAGMEEQPSADDGRLALLVRLLAQELRQPEEAIAWCQRMQQLFPQQDAPWHLHIELLLADNTTPNAAQLLEAEGLYNAWAGLRTGEAQACILDALAQHLRGAGEATAALRALEAALDVSDAGPERAQERLLVLAERYVARADLGRAEQTLGRLLQVMPHGPGRDAQARRLAELCEDHQDAPERALTALRALTHVSPDDARTMARLALALNDHGLFAALPAACDHVPVAALWRAGTALAHQPDLTGARVVLHALLSRLPEDTGQNPDEAGPPNEGQSDDGLPTTAMVWRFVDDVWQEHGAHRTLCAWRLAWAESAPGPWQVRARCTALLALHHQDLPTTTDDLLVCGDDERLSACMGRDFAREVLDAALVGPHDVLADAFALASTMHLPEMRLALGQRWLAVLPQDDGRRADPLLVCCEAALAAGDADQALGHAHELEVLGDAMGEPMMLRALAAQADRAPYLARLRARVDLSQGEPQAEHLLALATEQLAQNDAHAAQKSLERVGLLARDGQWGATAVRIYSTLGLHEAQAEAAALTAHLAPTNSQRAIYLREEAAVRWWELGDVEGAHALLHKAHQLQPLRYQDLDGALGGADVTCAKRRLHEALVVMPPALGATLLRRLAALLPHGPQRDDALREALKSASDNAHELGLLAEAARAASTHDVLQGALTRLAELAVAQEPRRAAKLWLEAAHGLPEHAAAPLWVLAAQALFAVGHTDEGAALVHRAWASNHRSLALATLVWRHLPQDVGARQQAARTIARHNQEHPEMAVPVPNPQQLHLAAAEAALEDGAHNEATSGAAFVLASNVDAAGAAIDVAHAQVALLIYERALEAQGNLPGLIGLWQRGCRMLIPSDPWVVTRRRRAAYFSVAVVAQAEAQGVWQALRDAEPELIEAQVQHWGLMAHDAQPVAMMTRIKEDLQPLLFGSHRVQLTLAAANLLGRHYPATDTAIAFLGTQLRLAMAAWQKQQQDGIEGDPGRSPVWLALAALCDNLAQNLGAQGSDGDKLAVLAHCARVAPQAYGLPRLAQAGFLAQAAHDEALAYTLLYPVAVAASHEGVSEAETLSAMRFCYEVAAHKRDARTVIDLLTRMAQRAAPKAASAHFAEAATWAEEGGLGHDQALRLLQASYALRPEAPVACRLVEGLLARGDVAAVLAAHFIFAGAKLDSRNTEQLGLKLVAALEAGRSRAAERAAAVLRVWRAIDAALPTLPAARGFRLQRARDADEPAVLLHALKDYLSHEPDAGGTEPASEHVRALHEEAAMLAQQQHDYAQAFGHWQSALSQDGASPLSLWRAFEGALAFDADDRLQAKAWLLRRVGAQEPQLKEQTAQASVPASTRIIALRLLCALYENEGNVQAACWGLDGLWRLVRDSDTTPHRRLAQAVSEQLIEALTVQQAWEPLAEHLLQAAQRAPKPSEQCQLYWQRGDILRVHLHEWRGAKMAYEQALKAQGDKAPQSLRMAAAAMALNVEEPHAALAHVALGANEDAGAIDTERLELVLQAMVKADDLGGCQSIVAELTRRDPANLFALHAGAVDAGRTADASERAEDQNRAELAWGSVAAALSARHASHKDGLCRRGEALDHVARYAQAQGAHERACQALRAAVQEDPTPSVRARRLAALTQACAQAGLYEEAALLCEARAEASQNPTLALSCWLEAADLWWQPCNKVEASVRALWQASALAPDMSDIWLKLMDRLPEHTEETERLAVADRLLLLNPKELQNKDRLSALAAAYASKDAHRALALFARAEAQGGVRPEHRALWEDVAWRCDDMQTFVPLAKAAEAADSAVQSRPDAPKRRPRQLVRRARLAEAYLLRDKSSRKDGLRFLRAAIALLPHPSSHEDVPAMRHVASICATEAEYADIALKLYAIVLEHTPLDVEALRIAARLAGRSQAIDRAYGLYACLLWLFPLDEEAKAFVEACRAQGPGQAMSASRGPWVKRVQQALDELVAQGAINVDQCPAKTFDVAQLLRRDIEVVLNNMLPLPPAQVARGRALSGSPEAMALFRFAQSPHYVRLRHKLGADLQAPEQH